MVRFIFLLALGGCGDKDPGTTPKESTPEDSAAPDTSCLAVFYADADGDGFGGLDYVSGCAPPEGYVTNADDCDDTAGDVHPGAGEIPRDGIDQDCDGADLDEPHPVERKRVKASDRRRDDAQGEISVSFGK